MEMQNIEKIEEEVKNLHLNPVQDRHSVSDKKTKEVFSLFWFLHLKPVIDYSKKLAKKYNADMEVVWLSAILHDLARLDDIEPHDEISAERAYNMLLEKGFNKGIAEDVKSTILTHRCRKYTPKTLEQKILATADAVSHFKTPFYLWFSNISNKPFKKQLESDLDKIEKDYHKKIFFENERKLVKKEYEVLKEWCSIEDEL